MKYTTFRNLPLSEQVDTFMDFVLEQNVKCSIPYLNNIEGINESLEGCTPYEVIQNVHHNDYYNPNQPLIIEIDYKTIDQNDLMGSPKIITISHFGNFYSMYHTEIMLKFIEWLEAL